MSEYRTFKHYYSSFEVYPRVHYFEKRFRDLLGRYKRITGTLPDSFKERNVAKELEQIKSDFESGLQVKVIGKEDIEDQHLVISASKETKPKRDDSLEVQTCDEPKVNVVVCHIALEDFSDKTLESTVKSLSQKGTSTCTFLLKGGSTRMYTEEEVKSFKHAVIEQHHIKEEDILIGPEDLQKRISDKLEEKIADGFSKISLSLQRFESDDNICDEVTGEVIESQEIETTIRDFLQNLSGMKDLTDQTKGVKETSIDGRLLQHLCHIIKCAAVSPFARKYDQQTWVCNMLLHEIKFEETLAGSVTKNTLYRLGQMENAVKSSSCDTKKFLHIQYLLQTDMKATFEETEKKFSGMRRLSLIMKRMLFETDGYLKQTNLGLSAVEKEKPDSPKLSMDLRKALLSVNGVFGLGTIYGKLEVHLDQSRFEYSANLTKTNRHGNSQHVDTDKNDYANEWHTPETNTEDTEKEEVEKQSLQKVKDEIAEQLQKHHFCHPYSVKFVEKKPEVMNASFEPGKALHSPTGKEGEYKFGTIGGYIESTERKLYGLTCFHVIGSDGKVYTGNGNELLGKYRKGIEDNPSPFIDIAAVEVIPSLQEKYKNYLEHTVSRITKVKVSFDNANDLIGRCVYKFGASTGVTKGTILTVDYNMFALEASDYLIVIDPLVAGEEFSEFSDVSTPLQGHLSKHAVHTDAQSSSRAGTKQFISQSLNATGEKHPQLSDTAVNDVKQAVNCGTQDVSRSLILAVQDSAKSQIATTSSESGSWADRRSSDKSGEAVAQSLNGEIKPTTVSSDSECQSTAKSSNTECQFVVRAEDTSRQNAEQRLVNVKQTVSKSSRTAVQKIMQPNIGVSQTTTQQWNTNVVKSLQIKSKPISKSRNDTRSTCTKPVDTIKQTDVCTRFPANEDITTQKYKNTDNFGLENLDKGRKEKDAVGIEDAKAKQRNKKGSRCPVPKLVMSSDSEEFNEQKHFGKKPNTFVYVRDIHGETESDESKPNDPKGIFSSNGDSGAIICTPDPASNGLTCLAVSMLTGGNFEVRGHHGMKSLSFTLSEGLSTICKHYNLTFL